MEKLTAKEKAGAEDISRVYEGLHLSGGFIRNMAMHRDSLSQGFIQEGERHFNICPKCSKQRDSFLPIHPE